MLLSAILPVWLVHHLLSWPQYFGLRFDLAGGGDPVL